MGEIAHYNYGNGFETFWLNDVRHREDGPAWISPEGAEWWYHGKQLDCNSQEEFEQLMKMKAFW
jgi:hypothetical protein